MADTINIEHGLLKQFTHWYGGEEAERLADRLNLMQHPDGGWECREKSVSTAKIPDDERARLTEEKKRAPSKSSLNDHATIHQIRFLARVLHAGRWTGAPGWIERGIKYVIGSQILPGGWGLFWPPTFAPPYAIHISFKDLATLEATKLLYEVGTGAALFDFCGPDLRARAMKAAMRGIDFILRSQIISGGVRKGWARNYDRTCLEVMSGRPFEPAAIDTRATAIIARFLESLPWYVARAAEEACDVAWDWLDRVAVHGIRCDDTTDFRIVADADAPRCWSKWVDIETDVPTWADTQGNIYSSWTMIPLKDRPGTWPYGTWGERILGQES